MASSESQRNVAGGSSPCHELFTDGICGPFAVQARRSCNYLKIMILSLVDGVFEKGILENIQGIGTVLKGELEWTCQRKKEKCPE
jgi:hypothetical protein